MNIYGEWDTNDVAYLAGLVIKYNKALNSLQAINAAADKRIEILESEVRRLKNEKGLEDL